MPGIDDYFREAKEEWDLSTLYADLASAKGKRLTPTEKLHLRGLLCGNSPTEMAEKLNKTVKGVETDLCSTVYRYVKALVSKQNNKIGNWRDICEWLDSAGYKCQSSTENGITEKNAVNVTNIKFENNEIQIDVFLQITIPVPTALSIEGLGLDKIITEE